MDTIPDDIFTEYFLIDANYDDVINRCFISRQVAKLCSDKFWLMKIKHDFSHLTEFFPNGINKLEDTVVLGHMSPRQFYLELYSLHHVTYGSEKYLTLGECVNRSLYKDQNKLLDYFLKLCDVGCKPPHRINSRFAGQYLNKDTILKHTKRIVKDGDFIIGAVAGEKLKITDFDIKIGTARDVGDTFLDLSVRDPELSKIYPNVIVHRKHFCVALGQSGVGSAGRSNMDMSDTIMPILNRDENVRNATWFVALGAAVGGYYDDNYKRYYAKPRDLISAIACTRICPPYWDIIKEVMGVQYKNEKRISSHEQFEIIFWLTSTKGSVDPKYIQAIEDSLKNIYSEHGKNVLQSDQHRLGHNTITHIAGLPKEKLTKLIIAKYCWSVDNLNSFIRYLIANEMVDFNILLDILSSRRPSPSVDFSREWANRIEQEKVGKLVMVVSTTQKQPEEAIILKEKMIAGGYIIKELKEFLRKLGLKVSGSKSELIQRLMPHSGRVLNVSYVYSTNHIN